MLANYSYIGYYGCIDFKVTPMNIKLGTFGRMSTFGASYNPTFKLVLIVGFCPANQSVHNIDLLLKPDTWTNVQPTSKVDRYVVLTPRLTAAGYLSNKNQRVGMTPMIGHLEKNWEPMSKADWLEKVGELNKTRGEVLAIATPEMWEFPMFQAAKDIFV